jgi:hypothetical protein
MSEPSVTGIKFQTDLGDGQMGLNTKNGSLSAVRISGTNLEEGSTVDVWNTAAGAGSKPSWSGPLKYNSDAGQFHAPLTCDNPEGVMSRGIADTDQVTVTVTNSSGQTGTYDYSSTANPVAEGP